MSIFQIGHKQSRDSLRPAPGAAGIALILSLILVGFAARSSRGDADSFSDFERDLSRICAAPAGALPSRVIGSAGYLRTQEYLRQQIGQIAEGNKSVVVGAEHEYFMMVPVTQSATLTISATGEREAVYPFWPANVRVDSTPAGGIRGRVVYIAQARGRDIHPGELRGQIAVIDASAGDLWRQALYFGASAVIVVGSAETNNFDLQSHDLSLPVHLPRFYVPQGAFGDLLRSGKITGEVVLDVDVQWERKAATNFYVLVKPPKAKPEGWTGAKNPAALLISVPYDSSGFIPDLAQGASQAVNTAAGLHLLRQAAAHPLNRPVLFFFGGGDSIQFRATREMLMAFSDVPALWTHALVDPDTGVNQSINTVQRELDRLNQVGEDPSRMDPYVDRELLDRMSKLIEIDVAEVQNDLFRLRLNPEHISTSQMKAEIEAKESTQRQLNQLRFLLQRRPASLKDVDPQHVDYSVLAHQYIERTRSLLGGGGLLRQLQDRQRQLQQRIDLYRWLAGELGLPSDPSDRDNNSRLIDLLVAIDLSDHGVRVGPLTLGAVQTHNSLALVQNYKAWLTRAYRGATRGDDPVDQWLKPLVPLLDLVDPVSNMQSPQSWLCGSLPIGSEMAEAWGVPGFSLVTLDDLRQRRDTPNDVLKMDHRTGAISSPDMGALEPQLGAVQQLLWHAWNDPAFAAQPQFNWQHTHIEGQAVGISASRPVPDLPMPGFLAACSPAAGTHKVAAQAYVPWTMGVRSIEVRDCDNDGHYDFEGLAKFEPTWERAVEVYRVKPEDRGAISATTDVGAQAGDIVPYTDFRAEIRPVRSVVFDCVEFTLDGLYDPRFLQNLNELTLLDAHTNEEPQRYNGMIGRQLMAGFVEPGCAAALLFRYGSVGNRLILLNMPPVTRDRHAPISDVAAGFTPDQLNHLGPMSLQTANDLFQINQYRLEKYRAAGVSSELIDGLHSEAIGDLLKASAEYSGEVSAAATRPTAADVLRDANNAWANEARVYAAEIDMASDVVHGAIFLLLLCVPFSFCMERLLIATPSIYRQIVYATLIFMAMAAVLWSFHPAFKISASPLIIILAFAIIFMSVAVIGVIYGKFHTELTKIRSGRGAAPTAGFARASVLMSAVMLGIANMRKRRFRTILTSITIVLITFAVLCFTSSSTFLDITALPTGKMPRVPSVALRQRGFRPLPTALLEDLNAVISGRPLVQRWWNIDVESKSTIHVVAAPAGPGQRPAIFAATAVLGLSPGQSTLSGIAEVIGHDQYARLENGETRIVYMCSDIAAQLGVKEGSTVTMGGIPLAVAGVFNAARFDSEVVDLDGEAIGPLNYDATSLDTQGRAFTDNTVDALDLDSGSGASELNNAYEHLSSGKFVIVPAAISRMLPSASLRSVGMRLDDYAQVKPVSDDLAKRFALAIFAGYQGGVKMVAANNSLPRVSGGSVAVPLAIAGLIIFNTMMGSIAERRREIHVYTSLGLAPLHVGALFVAEAMTYGLIGTVFGYIIGQGAGAVMTHYHLLGKVTLNYSGTSAMFTMGLILLIVLLSALVPAHLASKIAAPSIDRTWKVPAPNHDEIMAHLPFTINKTAADGALAYIAEFFDAHQEGSIGKFSSGKVEAFIFEDEAKRASRGLKTTIWLTPFDLGVRQHLMLLIHPGQFNDIYEVQVILQRLSGDDGSWYRMNRSFLTELRKQFLQWRLLTPQRMHQYIQASKLLFSPDSQPGAGGFIVMSL